MAINRKAKFTSHNKLLKKQRVKRYFIEAALEIANESGLASLTIRNVADRAGYYSASLYNYFSNLDQLKCYMALYLLEDNIGKLAEIQSEDVCLYEKYIKSCKSFCSCAFQNPSVYSFILRPSNFGAIIEHYEDYCEFFPRAAESPRDGFAPASLNTFFHKKNNKLLKTLIDNQLINEEEEENLSQFAALLFEGLLLNAMQNGNENNYKEYTDMFLEYYLAFLECKLKQKPDVTYKSFLSTAQLGLGVQLADDLSDIVKIV